MNKYFLGFIFLLYSFVSLKSTIYLLEEAIELLECNDSEITILNIDISRKRIGEAGIQVLSDAIIRNRTVTTLNLNISRDRIGEAGAQAMANAIIENRTIRSLNLNISRNRIGKAGAQVLADAIMRNESIINLNLDVSQNRIGDEGAQSISGAIMINKTMKRLDINFIYNRIGDAGAQAIANVIMINEAITNLSINLHRNLITEIGIQHIANAIVLNKTITTLNIYIYRNIIDFSGAQFIYNIIERNKRLAAGLNVNDSEERRLNFDGAEQAIEFLKANNSEITNLNLNIDYSSYPIYEIEVQDVVDAIAENQKITNLKIKFTHESIIDVGYQAIADAVIKNESITDLNLTDHDLFIDVMDLEDVLRRNKLITLFKNYLLETLYNQILTDTEVQGQGEVILLHGAILKERLGERAFEILQTMRILQVENRETARAFLHWVYSGYTTQSEEPMIRSICDILNVGFENKNGNENLMRDMRNLYLSKDSTGDFNIKFNGETIKVHVVIMIARSGLFRNMLNYTLNLNNDVDILFDIGLDTLNALIEFMYTGEILNLTSEIEDELLYKEVNEYFELPENELYEYLKYRLR